ncbi:hypothetical protein niasHS_002934 [Heterodera schachtii]|uniref:Glycosyltransferase family 92 protein n=1 Tax=Heterodera schachtii TaxID=97005 RepID=A0ABD2K988_HETSC
MSNSLPPHGNDFESEQTKSKLQYVLITAVYNRKSRLYTDNKIVLLINAPVSGLVDQTTFVAKTTNDSGHLQTNFALFRAAPPNIVCKWFTYMAVFDSAQHPNKLEIAYGAHQSVPVQFQLPYMKRHVHVGTCFSPLFLAEHWQLVVLAIEIYRHYGIQLQVVYLMSAIEGVFEILQAYNSRDNIQLEPWSSIEIDGEIDNEINREIDWRNQAASHTDCLLKYGYSAEFLIVGDMDDILIPDHQTYYSEFIRNDYRHKKNAVGLLYSRFTVDITTTRNPRKFSLFDALTSAKVALYQPDDPKYVVNTSRAESLWIHWPLNIKPNTSSRSVPSTDGRMLHFRNWHFLEDENGILASENYMHRKVENSAIWRSVALNESFLSTKTARQISRRFKSDIFKRNFGTFLKLPTNRIDGLSGTTPLQNQTN